MRTKTHHCLGRFPIDGVRDPTMVLLSQRNCQDKAPLPATCPALVREHYQRDKPEKKGPDTRPARVRERYQRESLRRCQQDVLHLCLSPNEIPKGVPSEKKTKKKKHCPGRLPALVLGILHWWCGSKNAAKSKQPENNKKMYPARNRSCGMPYTRRHFRDHWGSLGTFWGNHGAER